MLRIRRQDASQRTCPHYNGAIGYIDHIIGQRKENILYDRLAESQQVRRRRAYSYYKYLRFKPAIRTRATSTVGLIAAQGDA